jgi:hypothetical protein
MEPTLEQVESIYRMVTHAADVIINHEHDEVRPQILLMRADGTMLAPLPPRIMRMLFADGAGKDFARIVMRELLDGNVPNGVDVPDVIVNVSEAWSAHLTVDEMKARDADECAPPVSAMPGRREIVMCAIHSRTRSWLRILPIETLPDGHRRVTWPDFGDDPGMMTGRLVLNETEPTG